MLAVFSLDTARGCVGEQRVLLHCCAGGYPGLQTFPALQKLQSGVLGSAEARTYSRTLHALQA